jgi:RNA polymerase sigma factor for flagellar operon FliA
MMDDSTELAPLFKAFRPLIRYCANRFMRNAASSVAYDDLVQEGEIAVWRCLGTYRPQEGATFKTYATARIRGSMLDYLRTQQLGVRGEYAHVESWEEEQFADAGGTQGSPLEELLRKERIEQIVAGWQMLPRREREVLTKYYSDERRLLDIAQDYGITEARVSQIRKVGELRVRAHVRGQP